MPLWRCARAADLYKSLKADPMTEHLNHVQPVSKRGRSRLSSGLLTASMLALTAMPAAGAQGDIKLGEPSVLSQRGQRLKLAVPYGSATGERISSLGIEIVSIEAPDGERAPDLTRFTTATPEQRNLVFITSAERVDAAALTINYRFIDRPNSLQTWRVMVPPALMAESREIGLEPASARPAASRRSKRK